MTYLIRIKQKRGLLVIEIMLQTLVSDRVEV